MTSSQELNDKLDALTERINRDRADDKEQRHAQNKQVSKVCDAMAARLTDLETQFKEQEAICSQTEKTATRIFNLLQGDPELGQPGFIRRNMDQMTAINARLEEIERDKVDSRNHRAQTADVPARVTELESKLREREIERGAMIKLVSIAATAAGAIGGAVSWLLSLFHVLVFAVILTGCDFRIPVTVHPDYNDRGDPVPLPVAPTGESVGQDGTKTVYNPNLPGPDINDYKPSSSVSDYFGGFDLYPLLSIAFGIATGTGGFVAARNQKRRADEHKADADMGWQKAIEAERRAPPPKET